MTLPHISNTSLLHSQQCAQHISRIIDQSPQQKISFSRFMQEALFAPGLGYYTAGNIKLSSSTQDSDFTTAPEISPLFGTTLAVEIANVLRNIPTSHVLEFGAGTGKLALQICTALLPIFPNLTYFILEISPDLRQRQQELLKPFAGRVVWLDQLPSNFKGCVIANEVLDAMPVQVYEYDEQINLLERYVSYTYEDQQIKFGFTTAPCDMAQESIVRQRLPALPNYASEINWLAQNWCATLDHWLDQAVVLIIDYGFPQHEYYNEQRNSGTLMCHLRHHAHADVLLYPGIQDITAHVDFTAMADAAYSQRLEILGFTSQANFLINLGLLDILAKQHSDYQSMEYFASAGQVHKLVSEAEMGELFKVLAIGKNYQHDLLGFSHANRLHKL